MDTNAVPLSAQAAAAHAINVTPVGNAPPRGGLAGLGPRRLAALGGGILALVAIIAVAAIWGRSADYRVLFANLGDRDGGSVVAALTQMNVPYKYAEGGGAILVPAQSVHDVRLRLASQGLPKGGAVGFELMENQKFGVTQFQERLNFQRGLEGELSRSIQSLAAVQSARVHLAMPTNNGFLRDQQKPTASVLLTMHPARSLDRAQVDGIVHLVASSVPDLAPTQVSVVDQNGTLLSAKDVSANGLDQAQLGYVRRLEAEYNRRILDIVAPLVGSNNVRAQVTADVDFTQSELTAEEFRPNQGRDAQSAVRSQQVSEAPGGDGAGGGGQGVAGALSNQPPGPSSAPVNGNAQALQAANQGGANGASGGSGSRRDATTNYEVDRTVRVTRNATGAIRRLSAAVVLNHRQTVDADGKAQATPLTAAEVEQITTLVRESIGASKERGDSVNVVSAAFNLEAAPKVPEVQWWREPDNLSMAKEVGKHLALVLLGLVTIFGVIRPALKQIPAAASTGGRINETIEGEVTLPPLVGGGRPASPEALKLARGDPAAVANVVRAWVSKE